MDVDHDAQMNQSTDTVQAGHYSSESSVPRPMENGISNGDEEISNHVSHSIKREGSPMKSPRSSDSTSPTKHSSSSSSSKHGHQSSKHSSSKHSSLDKHKSSSDKHKSSSSGDKKHSSSSGDKHKSSSSGDKKHSSEDRHKSHKNKHKDKHRDKDRVKVKSEDGEVKVKSEPMTSPVKVKKEVNDEDDTPLSVRKESKKRPTSDDDEPLSARVDKSKKIKKEEKASKRKADVSDDDDIPLSKRKKESKDVKKVKKEVKKEKKDEKPGRKKKEKEEEPEKWRWWEEDRVDDGTKWKFLEHNGPVFAPDYEPLPKSVKFLYDGSHFKLSPSAEEVAGFYGRMIEHDYTTKDVFNKNFFKDWRKYMNKEERELITDLKKCNFNNINEYYKMKSEERKAMSKEEKLKIKEENARLVEEYGFCTIDGHKEKIGNFRIEPPGLFRGRGDHPKMGMLKTRTNPEDIIINCSKKATVPPPPKGHKWKEVRHDNTVSWLACWQENVQNQTKYIMLNAASKLKGEKDWQKYEIARKLHKSVDRIRAQYMEDFKSKEMRIRQRSVALYFIDKLALRAGNEKETDETADTVGCCSLRVEHIKLHDESDGKEWVVEFDFLGKDSIRYQNKVPVEKRVYKNLKLFVDKKDPEDDLFDRLNTGILNKHLHDLMEGLTAKVFRTYNASHTLQEQLNLLTTPDDSVPAKILSYNRANRAVAILCNHQRAAPKNFDKQRENMENKIKEKKLKIKEAKKAAKDAKASFKSVKTESNKTLYERKKKMLEKLNEQLMKLEVSLTDKDENKEIALGTSKLNYLDPRISVAWCKKYEVPIEKIYNKTQRDKFAWAIDMADEDFQF